LIKITNRWSSPKSSFFVENKKYEKKIKQLIFKTIKYEFKKEHVETPTYLETLRPTIELKEYRHLKKIKPKFKKVGNIKLLVVPKEIKQEKKKQEDLFIADRRVVDTVRNAYSREKTTNLKEKRFIDKLSVPKGSPINNNFIQGMLKTCNFIENENIHISNRIKSVSRRLTKKLNFVNARDAFVVTK